MMARMSARASARADSGGKIFRPVADDGLEGDGDADLVEFFSEIKGIGVLPVRGEHLGADGDDFGFHV